ncbi:MAG: sodium ion-translocating decarboxylase subunit beta [Butyrivibrio sp.]|jgi:hypothetical protein|uniref:hypothetical protein n=1 Tax=Butyrivibrio sp. TaxID=28121 RepID=UPI001EBE8BED|nr:hypothetical protein [Butyrivibrio sp.]MBE5841182.1 sodium ion-translocating decarboxylase subunit beta [Butyrivibrio sp.]
MKREMLIALMLIITIGAAGCSAKDENTGIIGGADGPTSIYLSSNENEPVISGTWQTASIGYEVDGEMQPEYYVKFSDSEIIYGHMEKNDFVPDHIDSISNFEKLSEGGYKVQAESESGVQYTYRSAEGDINILEYYATWDEKDFSEKYSGSSSLSRCE